MTDDSLIEPRPHKLLWIDEPDAVTRLNQIRDPKIRIALQGLIRDGYAVLPRNIPYSLCDQIIDEFADYCALHPEHSDFSDSFNLHDRLAGFHMSSLAARELAHNPLVLSVVTAAFERSPVVAGSLFFERGSMQSIHRDSPAFFTVPLNHYFGVWHALEDVHPDSGALVYYQGGHLILPDRDFVGTGYDNMENYFETIRSVCRERGLPLRSFTAKKGDTLIWHPQLPHGGSNIVDASRSRRSIVFHYIIDGSPMWGPNEFFGPQDEVSCEPNMNRLDLGDGLMALDWGKPLFIKNRRDGNFKDQSE